MANLTKPIDDLFIKAIIGGKSYTVDQAYAEAKALWEKQGGKDIEAWYLDWWGKEKNNILVWDDFYKIYESQRAAFK
ncbi:hypothetical protein D3C85_1860290 [compost metagenome]